MPEHDRCYFILKCLVRIVLHKTLSGRPGGYRKYIVCNEKHDQFMFIGKGKAAIA